MRPSYSVHVTCLRLGSRLRTSGTVPSCSNERVGAPTPRPAATRGTLCPLCSSTGHSRRCAAALSQLRLLGRPPGLDCPSPHRCGVLPHPCLPCPFAGSSPHPHFLPHVATAVGQLVRPRRHGHLAAPCRRRREIRDRPTPSSSTFGYAALTTAATLPARIPSMGRPRAAVDNNGDGGDRV